MTACFRWVVLRCLLLACVAALTSDQPAGRIAGGTPAATPWFVQDSGVAGPTVMVMGGVHGDEPAGAAAADQIRHWPVTRGKLIVVPRANLTALAAGKRLMPGVRTNLANLNRNFPAKGEPDAARGELAAELWAFARGQKPAWLVDLHEGVGTRGGGSKSVGSSVIVFPAPETDAAAAIMLAAVNASITNYTNRFVQLRRPVAGSLARAAGERLGAHAMILETTTRNQPLSKRVRQHRVMVHALLEHLNMVDPSVTVDQITAPPRAPGEKRVALYDAGGSSGAGVPRVSEQLSRETNVTLALVGPEDIRGGVLGQFDVVMFTGGSGSQQAAALEESGRAQVKQFVENGGGFIGICAGAYLPCAGFSWGVKILDAKTKSPKWQRGNGTVKIELTDEGRAIFGDLKGTFDCRYAQGPILMPAQAAAVPDYETLAFFRTELAENDTPKGIMIDSPAIVAGRFGKGRVLAISPHPEQTAGLEQFVPRAVTWVAEPR
jgi:predicted deacylase/putative intracellular protease/amidase